MVWNSGAPELASQITELCGALRGWATFSLQERRAQSRGAGWGADCCNSAPLASLAAGTPPAITSTDVTLLTQECYPDHCTGSGVMWSVRERTASNHRAGGPRPSCLQMCHLQKHKDSVTICLQLKVFTLESNGAVGNGEGRSQ